MKKNLSKRDEQVENEPVVDLEAKEKSDWAKKKTKK